MWSPIRFAFAEFIRAPRSGEVYNIGGSRHSNCSMLEAIAISAGYLETVLLELSNRRRAEAVPSEHYKPNTSRRHDRLE